MKFYGDCMQCAAKIMLPGWEWLGVTRQSWPGEGNLGDATIVALPGSQQVLSEYL